MFIYTTITCMYILYRVYMFIEIARLLWGYISTIDKNSGKLTKYLYQVYSHTKLLYQRRNW